MIGYKCHSSCEEYPKLYLEQSCASLTKSTLSQTGQGVMLAHTACNTLEKCGTPVGLAISAL